MVRPSWGRISSSPDRTAQRGYPTSPPRTPRPAPLRQDGSARYVPRPAPAALPSLGTTRAGEPVIHFRGGGSHDIPPLARPALAGAVRDRARRGSGGRRVAFSDTGGLGGSLGGKARAAGHAGARGGAGARQPGLCVRS